MPKRLWMIFAAKPTNSGKLGRILMLVSCAANGFRICVYLRSSAVPNFQNCLLIRKYRRPELNIISKIHIGCAGEINEEQKDHTKNHFHTAMLILLESKDILTKEEKYLKER
jgi:hypothetical protein